MSVLLDCLLTKPSEHTILGIPVSFYEMEKQPTPLNHMPLSSIDVKTSKFLCHVLNDPFYSLIHKMGHALTMKCFGHRELRYKLLFLTMV